MKSPTVTVEAAPMTAEKQPGGAMHFHVGFVRGSTRGKTCRSTGRLSRVAAGVGVATLVVTALQIAGQVAPPPAHAATVYVEAPDFASEVYQDPWDYGDAADMNTDTSSGTNSTVSGGLFQTDLASGEGFSPVTTVPGSLSQGRDGAAIPIDTGRYKHLSFQMTSGVTQTDAVGAIYWFTCREQLATCAGGITFRTLSGSNTYDLSLDGASTIGARLPWSGFMYGLRVIPAINMPAGQRVHTTLDWMRLYAPSADNPHSNLPPGSYSGYTIESRPEPVIDSPSPADGQDLPVAQGRRDWTLTNSANAAGIQFSNVQLAGYDDRGMVALNANSSGDPSLTFPVAPFNANTYHWLSFDLKYDGPFDLSGNPGGGKLARVVWYDAGTAMPQDSNDIVTYSRPNASEITIDMTRSDILDENSRNPRLGWGGQTVTGLRFDPNEDPGRNVWYLRSLHVRADPTAQGSTTVRFHDNAWVAGTTADVLVGTSAPGTAYTPIATGVPVTSGVNSSTFSLSQASLPAGNYHVQVVLHHPAGGASQNFSTAPIVMTRDASSDPRGGFDGVTRVPGGVSVAGWSFDPDSANPIHVRAYVDGTFAADFATSKARPDVKSGYPAAPTNSGFDAGTPGDVVSVPSGQHTVCLYGINVGAGGNTTIGCRSVTISGTAIGSLDAVSPVPGGLSATGWGLDPDTASPIQVHVYLGSTGNPVIANITRDDIGQAFPGYGTDHGFRTDFGRPAGDYTACAYAIGTAGNDTGVLGCKSVTVGRTAPIGSFDVAQRVGNVVTVQGWAIDRDTYNPIQVHFYVNGVGTPVTASTSRPDVASAFPDWGPQHGFNSQINAPSGASICAYAIDNSGAAGNTLLGCRTA